LMAAGQPAERFVVTVTGRPLPEMWADGDRIHQVVANLLENALRHGRGTVTVLIEPSDGGAAVTVTDEGPGVPEQIAGRIFAPFWKDPRRGGTGLGLYIVKGLIEAHGGRIDVTRAPSGGASFRFVLPQGVPEHMIHEG
jgi:signal transduction histidine kinase